MANDKKEFKSSYTNGQRIAAVIGVVLLVLMYLVTLVAAITASTYTSDLFRMCIAGSIVIPVVLWIFIRLTKRSMERDRKAFEELQKGELKNESIDDENNE